MSPPWPLRARLVRKSGRAWVAAFVLFPGCTQGQPPGPELIGWAVLPADHFVPGPTSGQFIEATNGRTPPFPGRQPVQGFSALIAGDEDGTLLALVDNGFATKENSVDFLLRVYELRLDLRTAEGGPGVIHVEPAFFLHDPDRRIPFPIVADLETYPGSDVPVDAAIRESRLLTGGDFDVESFRRVEDGTFYFGDEFGPYLLHTDGTGRLLEPPIPLPGVWSPQNPERGDAQPNASRSGGFEGMALSADGFILLPILEHPLEGRDWLYVYAFDLAERRYRHQEPDSAAYRYRLEPDAVAVPELVHWRGTERYLAVERDDFQGLEARFKKVFAVDLAEPGADGGVSKTEVLDLLDIPDPHDVGRTGTGRFTFPFWTTEALMVLDDSTIAILNDNNYPFSVGRHVESGEPDDSELVLVRIR